MLNPKIQIPQTPLERLLYPIQEFIKAETSSGLLLIAVAVLALLWANSPWSGSYHDLWNLKFSVKLGDFFKLDKPVLLWINDGLMAVFFFVVGLEIKREVMVGELKSLKKASLPIAAALGGMVVPATLYALINAGKPGITGWGIPMATDIAFALGILALVGNHAPLSLKIFLTALAIVDDLGAVLIIALFYTETLSWISLGVAAMVLLLMFAANWAGVRHPLVYGLLGMALWVALLKSGVHATIAGVLGAMAIPSQIRINSSQFLNRAHLLIAKFEQTAQPGLSVLTNRQQLATVQALEDDCKRAQSPMQRLEHTLHYWTAFLIVPVFALANAGVTFGGDFIRAVTEPISLGIIVGLVVGKQVGITLFSWLAIKLKLADLPQGLTWQHIYGAGWLGGIGFTMSLFVGNLAFGAGEMLDTAKTGILSASVISGLVGWWLLRRATELAEKDDPVLQED